jgi:hypothetical protein
MKLYTRFSTTALVLIMFATVMITAKPLAYAQQPVSPAASKPVNKRNDVSSLQAELRARQLEVARLSEERRELEARLIQQGADLDRGTEERGELDKKLAATQISLQAAENKVNLATQQNGQETAQSVEQQTKIGELSASLRERDQKITEEEELLEHDRDIRNLMGARHLYISRRSTMWRRTETHRSPSGMFFIPKESLWSSTLTPSISSRE